MKKIVLVNIIFIFLLFACNNVSDKKNDSFLTETNASLNKEITVKRTQSNTPELIGFIVSNHSEETITFPDQGFGVRIYYYNEGSQQWNQKLLSPYPAPRPKTLPSGLDVPAFSNMWSILETDIIALHPQEYRLYVEGNGDFTNEKYGAFFDFIIQE